MKTFGSIFVFRLKIPSVKSDFLALLRRSVGEVNLQMSPLISPQAQDSPGPHEGMIVSIEGGQVLEHVIIWAHALLTLLRVRAVVPGVVDHHPTNISKWKFSYGLPDLR